MRAEFTAFKDYLNAVPVLTGNVHDAAIRNPDGSVKRVTTAYVIVFGGSPDALGDDRMTALQRADSKAEYVYTVRSVGPTADSARAVAAVVLNRLVGAKITVPNRRVDPLRLTYSRELDVDADIMPALYFVDNEYTLITHRA